MDCTHARLLFLFARPAEHSGHGHDFDLLESHLEQCGECRELARKESLVDQAVGAALRAVPVPTGLASRILERVEHARRPRPWTWLAAAAALFVTVGLGVAWACYPPPPLDPGSFQWVHAPVTAEHVTDWLHSKDFDVEAPQVIDFAYLDSFEMVSIQGRQVPRLLFVNEAHGSMGVAHVYVISRRKFRWDDDFAQSMTGGSRLAEMHPAADNGDYFFLVIYSAGSRDSFPRRNVT